VSCIQEHQLEDQVESIQKSIQVYVGLFEKSGSRRYELSHTIREGVDLFCQHGQESVGVGNGILEEIQQGLGQFEDIVWDVPRMKVTILLINRMKQSWE
jgi:hypothetical protein